MDMELIERYLHEIGRRLPPNSREDILKELRSLILDKLEGRVIEGQPTRAHVIAVLKEMGSPKQVAASYAGERYLVGPTLYPKMIQTMRIVLSALLVLPLLGLWQALTTDFASMGAAFEFAIKVIGDYFNTALAAIGLIVAVFAWLEWQDVRIPHEPETWNPEDLPAITNAGRVGYFSTSVEIAFNVVAFAFGSYFLQQGGLPFFNHPDAPGHVLPISASLLVGLLVTTLLQIVVQLYVIVRGRWQVSTRIIDAVLDLAGLYYAFGAAQQVAAQIADYLPDAPSVVGTWADWTLTAVFTVIVVLVVIEHVVNIYKLITNSPAVSRPVKASPAKG